MTDTLPLGSFFSPPPRPATETWRLKRLHDLDVLDTPADPALDAIVAEAATAFAAPIALVSLIDRHRQWFKARVGLDVAETPRALSFCGYTILTPEPLIVLDAHADPRFAGNPLVGGAPHVVFYAGFPLITSDGHALGSLCIIDGEPRAQVAPALIALGRTLAARVIARLEDVVAQPIA